MHVEVERKLNELLANGSLSKNDPKYNSFKDKILPSVVFQWILPNGENSFNFKCPFENCQSLCSRSVLMERHLKEQHHHQIPLNVFGFKSSFECNVCTNQVFKRYEHLKTHKKGNKHLKMLIQSGLATNEERIRWQQICRLKKSTSRSFDSITHENSSFFSDSQSNCSLSLKTYFSKSTESLIDSFKSNETIDKKITCQSIDYINDLSLSDLNQETNSINFITSTPREFKTFSKSIEHNNKSKTNNNDKSNKENNESQLQDILDNNLLIYFQNKDSFSEKSQKCTLNNSSFSHQTSKSNCDNKSNIGNFLDEANSEKNSQSKCSLLPAFQEPSFKKRKLNEAFEQNSLSLDTIEMLLMSKRTLSHIDFD